MKRLLSSLLLITLLLLPVTVNAAEINPDASTYGYGSTSETSNEVNASGGSLATTGDPVQIIEAIAILLVLVGVGLGIRMVIQKKKRS
jgi:hypothetical protein